VEGSAELSQAWHDINDPGFFGPKEKGPGETKPVDDGGDCREDQRGQSPEVRLISAAWEPGREGFQFNKQCDLKITAEFLKETFRKKLSCGLFVMFEGTEYDLNHQVDAQLDDNGTATARMTLYYADAYFNSLQDNPAATCQYKAKVTHPTAKGDLESELLEMPKAVGDWIELELQDEAGNPLAGEPFICHFHDGKKHEGNLDKNGFVRIEQASPGSVVVTFPNYPTVSIKQ
jgi:hypothetical protein